MNEDEDDKLIFDDNEDSFVNPNDVVEVQVDDDDVPMEDDDDEDDDEAANDTTSTSKMSETANTENNSLPDMSTHTITSHKPSSVYAVAAHVDSASAATLLVTGGGDDKAFLHTLHNDTLTTVPLPHAHTDSVSCVATNLKYITPDATKTPPYIAVGSYDGSIALYDTDGKEIRALDGPTDVEFVSFHPKGGSVLLAGSIADATVWMYHLPTSKCLQVFVGHECNSEGGGVTAGAFTPDGKFAVTVGMDGTMRIWAPRTGLCKHVFKLVEDQNNNMMMEDGGGGPSGLTCLAMNGGPDGQLAIAGGEDGSAHVVHLQGKKVVSMLKHFDSTVVTPTKQMNDQQQEEEEEIMLTSVEAVGFASKKVNCNWVATGGSDGILKIWDLTHGTGQCRQICKVGASSEQSSDATAATGGITRISWHPTLPLVFASYSDGIVRIWDARDGILIQSITGGSAGVSEGDENQINDFAVEVSNLNNGADGTAHIATANDDGTVRFFDVDVGAILTEATNKKSMS